MPLSTVLTSVIGWLRAGYPEGVPEHDYLPLFALLARRLSDEDVSAVAEELARSQTPADAHAIRMAISGVTHELPSDNDVARVSARLAAGGWPLAQPGGP